MFDTLRLKFNDPCRENRKAAAANSDINKGKYNKNRKYNVKEIFTF